MKKKTKRTIICIICVTLITNSIWSADNELLSEFFKGNVHSIDSTLQIKERKVLSYLLNDIPSSIHTDSETLWEWLLTSNGNELLANLDQSDLGYLPTIYLHVAASYGLIPSDDSWNHINYAKNVFYTHKLDFILDFLKGQLIKGVEFIPAVENTIISFANQNMKPVVYYGFQYGLYCFICVDAQAITLNYELIDKSINVNQNDKVPISIIYQLLNNSDLFEVRFSKPIKLFLDTNTNELMVSIPEMILFMKKVGAIARFSTWNANGIDTPIKMKLILSI